MRFFRSSDVSSLATLQTFVSGYGPTRTLHNKLGEDAQESLKRDFISFYEGFRTELGICVPRDYWVVYGTRR